MPVPYPSPPFPTSRRVLAEIGSQDPLGECMKDETSFIYQKYKGTLGLSKILSI